MWCESCHYVSGRTHEKLFEVPRDVGSFAIARLRILQPAIQGGLAIAIDIDLCEHRKVGVVVRLGKLEDLLVRSWLLSTKLITRKRQHLKTVGVVMKRTQTCVLAGEASTTRYVDDERSVSTKGVEGNLLTGNGFHLEFAE